MAEARNPLAQAQAALKRAAWSEAVRLLAPVVHADRENIQAWDFLAAAFFGLGDWKHAYVAARQVVRLAPHSARAWCNLGTVLRKQGRLEEALRAQHRALQIDRNYSRARTELQKVRQAIVARASEGTDEDPEITSFASAATGAKEKEIHLLPSNSGILEESLGGCHICSKKRPVGACYACNRQVCQACSERLWGRLMCVQCAPFWMPNADKRAITGVVRDVRAVDGLVAKVRPRRLASHMARALDRLANEVAHLRDAGAHEAARKLAQTVTEAGQMWRHRVGRISATIPAESARTTERTPSIDPAQRAAVTQEVLAAIPKSPLQDPDIENMVRLLAGCSTKRMPKLWLSEEAVPNAMAVGFTPDDAHIIITKGLLQCATPHELFPVLAHEMAHIELGHCAHNTALAAKAMGIVIAADLLGTLTEWVFYSDDNPDNDWIGLLVGVGIRVVGSAVAAHNLSKALHRCEFAADARGAALSGAPTALAAALSKIETIARRHTFRQLQVATKLAHLFIVPAGLTWSLFQVSTHPDTPTRALALQILADLP